MSKLSDTITTISVVLCVIMLLINIVAMNYTSRKIEDTRKELDEITKLVESIEHVSLKHHDHTHQNNNVR